MFESQRFRIPNPTSGHLQLIAMISTFIRNDQSDLRTQKTSNNRRSHRKRHEHTNKAVKDMQNSLVFIGFQAHRDIRSHYETYDDERDRGYKHFSKIHLRNSTFFSWQIKVFQGFRATAPQTYDRFRTSNGAADVLYVSSKSLTPPQTYNIFLSMSEKHMWRKVSRWIHARKPSRRLKPPQTNDTPVCVPSFSPQTCEKKKNGFLEVNFL